MRKFAALFFPRNFGNEYRAYMIEAETEEQAESILDEELGYQEPGKSRVDWAASKDTRWRGAWRRGEVDTLRALKLPEGLE